MTPPCSPTPSPSPTPFDPDYDDIVDGDEQLDNESKHNEIEEEESKHDELLTPNHLTHDHDHNRERIQIAVTQSASPAPRAILESLLQEKVSGRTRCASLDEMNEKMHCGARAYRETRRCSAPNASSTRSRTGGRSESSLQRKRNKNGAGNRSRRRAHSRIYRSTPVRSPPPMKHRKSDGAYLLNNKKESMSYSLSPISPLDYQSDKMSSGFSKSRSLRMSDDHADERYDV